MAYAITQQGDNTTAYLTGFVVDTLADIETLPVKIPAGSTCICLEDSSVWMLGVNKDWKPI